MLRSVREETAQSEKRLSRDGSRADNSSFKLYMDYFGKKKSTLKFLMRTFIKGRPGNLHSGSMSVGARGVLTKDIRGLRNKVSPSCSMRRSRFSANAAEVTHTYVPGLGLLLFSTVL